MMTDPSFRDRPLDCYDRPGEDQVQHLRGATITTIESIDSPADLLADALNQELREYDGPLPGNHDTLRQFVVGCFKSAAGPTAVSAMIAAFVESDERVHMANTIRRMLCIIRSQERPEMTCDAIAIAIGVHIGEARTIAEIARKHGVTKQAMSKRAIRICDELGLDPSVLMRSEDSRESYRIKQLERHAATRDAGMGKGTMASLKARLVAARKHKTRAELRAQPADLDFAPA